MFGGELGNYAYVSKPINALSRQVKRNESGVKQYQRYHSGVYNIILTLQS